MRASRHTKPMKLTFTHDQLTAECIANVLNSAYITTEVEKENEGEENETSIAKSVLDDFRFEVLAGSRDDVIFRSYVTFSKDYDEQRLRKAADYMDFFPVDSSYCAGLDDGGHVMCFHHNHVIPEDETISPAYLVKLTRYFVKALGTSLRVWEAIEDVADKTV